MVNILKEKDLPEPWFGKKTKAQPPPKQTRAASKLLAEKATVEDAVGGEPSISGKGRGKGKQEKHCAGMGRKKGKSIRTGTVDVMLGRSKNPVQDPEELRRKIIEDAVACGRVVKTISNPAKRQTCPTMATRDSSAEKIDEEMGTADIQNGFTLSRPNRWGFAISRSILTIFFIHIYFQNIILYEGTEKARSVLHMCMYTNSNLRFSQPQCGRGRGTYICKTFYLLPFWAMQMIWYVYKERTPPKIKPTTPQSPFQF